MPRGNKGGIPAERGEFLTIGVSRNPMTMNVQLKRACGVLARNGFRVGIPTNGSIVVAAKRVVDEQRPLDEPFSGQDLGNPNPDQENK